MTTLHSSLLLKTLGKMPDEEMRPIDRRLADALGLFRLPQRR